MKTMPDQSGSNYFRSWPGTTSLAPWSSPGAQRYSQRVRYSTGLALAALLFAGCQSGSKPVADSPPPPSTTVATPPAPVPPAAVTPPTPVAPVIRINAGSSAATLDAGKQNWLPDQGFVGGDTIDRGNDVTIANTADPAIYRTERYSMTAFAQPLPNGKYTVKLHFAETFEGVTAPGERVFSFNVEGREFKDFDVFAKAGGANKAYVETVSVEVKDGQLDIVFTSQIENPEINGIEIIPAS